MKLSYKNEYLHAPDHCKVCVVVLNVIIVGRLKALVLSLHSRLVSNQMHFQNSCRWVAASDEDMSNI